MFRGILTKRTTSNSDYRKSEEKENLVVNSNTNSNGNGNGGDWFTERGAKFVPVPVGVAVAQYGPNPPRVPSRANANERMNSGVGVGERGMGLEDRERVLEVKTMDRAFDKLLVSSLFLSVNKLTMICVGRSSNSSDAKTPSSRYRYTN